MTEEKQERNGNRMKKKNTVLKAVLAAGISIMSVMTAFAGEWKQDEYGWKYQYDDTHYAADTWIGNYYVGDLGYMLNSQLTPDGYMLNDDGSYYAALPENAAEVYKKYRLFYYGPAFDGAAIGVNYILDDFNHDGVLEMLTFDGIFETDDNVPTTARLMTIRDGKVVVADSIDSSNDNGIINFSPFEFKGETVFAEYHGDDVSNVYRINENLKFEKVQRDRSRQEWWGYFYSNNENKMLPVYNLDYTSLLCHKPYGGIYGEEKSTLEK